MTYDFDKEVNRRDTNCVKWDEFTDPDIIPLWVADMDFETAPCIQQALIERMQHGCFGYTHVPESYYDANIQWFQRRHHWTIDRTSFIYTSGVVPAISAIIKAFNKAKSAVIKPKAEEEAAPTTKECPFCKSEISIDAIRCPQCTSQLDPDKKS